MKNVIVGIASLLLACAGSNARVEAQSPSRVAPHAAHDLLVDTGACWLGGMWGDVQGETPNERAVSSRERCESVVSTVFSHDAHDRFLKLRAFEPETLAEVRNTLTTLADSEPSEAHRKSAYGRIFDALALAEHETMNARRAAHRVVRDVEREPEVLDATETAALPDLEAFSGFDALMHVDAGDLQNESHVFMLLVTLDRLQVAQQLPVHLKPYVLAAPLRAVFGTPAPDLPHDASKPLPRGGWLAYLVTGAASAGHAVPDALTTPVARHDAAVAGILEGVADLLRRDVVSVSSDTGLPRVVELTIRALEQSRDRAAVL